MKYSHISFIQLIEIFEGFCDSSDTVSVITTIHYLEFLFSRVWIAASANY